MKKIIVVLILVLFLSGSSVGQSVSVYYDSRGYVTTYIEAASQFKRLNYFGFVDYHTRPNRYFTRHILRCELFKGLGVHAKYDLPYGFHGLGRFGIGYHIPVHKGWVQVIGYGLETDHRGAQLAIVWSIPITKRIQSEGFLDRNWNQNVWIGEPQIVRQLKGPWAALIEVRINQLERRAYGIAMGLRWKGR